MKTGKSLSELAQEIERQHKVKEDAIVDTRALSMTDTGESLFIAGGLDRQLPIQKTAHRQISERLQIPAKYYDRLRDEAPALLATNVNHWFHENPEERLIRMLDGRVRALLSNRYQRIDNFDMANVVFPTLANIPGLEIKSTEITENRLYIKAVSTAVRLEVDSLRARRDRSVGDVVEAGIVISNSEVGLGSISVMPFFHFLVCRNGMVRNKDGFRAHHTGRKNTLGDETARYLTDEALKAEDNAILLKLRDVLSGVMNEDNFRTAVLRMQETTENRIEGDISKAVEVTAKMLDFTKEESSLVLRHLAEGGDLTQYGLMNAVTRTAEDLQSYDRATEFETAGGVILDLNKSQWKDIATAA